MHGGCRIAATNSLCRSTGSGNEPERAGASPTVDRVAGAMTVTVLGLRDPVTISEE